jgi:hypothetical protein
MTKKQIEEKRARGKPLGTRQKDGLYTKILELLQQDKDQKGDGCTPYAISGYLGEPYPTIKQYIQDLINQKKVTSKRISNLDLIRIK